MIVLCKKHRPFSVVTDPRQESGLLARDEIGWDRQSALGLECVQCHGERNRGEIAHGNQQLGDHRTAKLGVVKTGTHSTKGKICMFFRQALSTLLFSLTYRTGRMLSNKLGIEQLELANKRVLIR